MHLEWQEEIETGDMVIKLRITRAELEAVRLNKSDRALMEECDNKNAIIADHILSLEVLCRRIEANDKK